MIESGLKPETGGRSRANYLAGGAVSAGSEGATLAGGAETARDTYRARVLLSKLCSEHEDPFGCLDLLEKALANGTISRGRIVEVADGKSLTSRELSRQTGSQGSVLVVLSKGIRAETEASSRLLPVGYAFDSDEQSDVVRLVASNGSFELLELPKSDFAAFHSHDRSFATCLQHLVEATHPAIPMPEAAREQIRHTRGQNILALVTREGIRAVNGPDGILAILNPERHDVQSPFEPRYGTRKITAVQQMWAIIKGVSSLAVYLNRDELTRVAEVARLWVQQVPFPEAERAGLALHVFRLMLRKKESELVGQRFPGLLGTIQGSEFSEESRVMLLSRCLEIAWLGTRLKGEMLPVDHKLWDNALSSILRQSLRGNTAAFDDVLWSLDRRVETLFNALRKREEAGILSIAIEQLPATFSLRRCECKEVPADDERYACLGDLLERLLRGEVSAVGGSAYAKMRFPDEMLENISMGRVQAVLFNGRHQDGIEYVRRRFGGSAASSSVLEPCTVVNLQGAYGAFSRSWIFFRDGRSIVLVSHLGKSRQLSNAGALILYRNGGDQRVPIKNLILVDGVSNLRAEMDKGLADILRRSEKDIEGRSVLGTVVANPSHLPTQVLILLHPTQLKETLRDAIELTEYRTESLGTVHMGYVRNKTGGLTRLIIPSVGGSGLYGDTAGLFIESIFTPGLIPNLVPHIIFSATAGGFAGTTNLPIFRERNVRGLPPAIPGGFLMPTSEIHDDEGVLPMTTLLQAVEGRGELKQDVERIRRALADACVYQYDRHYSIKHPGDETYQKIERLVRDRLVSSIDVEAGPLQKAIIKVRSFCPEATITPIYYFSDDPRSGKEDRFRTLAYGGPLHDNWKPDLRLNPVLLSLMDAAFLLHQRTGAVVPAASCSPSPDPSTFRRSLE